MIGLAKPASLPSRRKVTARKLDVCSSKKRMNCLGYIVRDRGHRRVPEPPESITGKIASMGSWPSTADAHAPIGSSSGTHVAANSNDDRSEVAAHKLPEPSS